MSRATELEIKALKEFRGRVKDILVTNEQKGDPFLLRWLRARELDLNKAEEMLRNSLKWRKETDADNIMTRAFDPWITSTYPYYIEGRDIEGRPVLELPLGSWDIRKAVEKGEEEELLAYIIRLFESAHKAMRDRNAERNSDTYPITQIIMIVDWDNYSYSQLMHWKALQKILTMAGTYEAHYPEMMLHCFFINTPSIFPILMTMFKSMLAANTIRKITCHSSKADWEPLIRKLVPKDQLSPFLGGTRKIKQTILNS